MSIKHKFMLFLNGGDPEENAEFLREIGTNTVNYLDGHSQQYFLDSRIMAEAYTKTGNAYIRLEVTSQPQKMMFDLAHIRDQIVMELEPDERTGKPPHISVRYLGVGYDPMTPVTTDSDI